MSAVGNLAPIVVESPQRNRVERGLGTESGEPVYKLFYRIRFLKIQLFNILG